MSRPAGLTRALGIGFIVLGGAAAGCRGAGHFLERLLEERPPAALDSLPLASDARLARVLTARRWPGIAGCVDRPDAPARPPESPVAVTPPH